MTNSDKALLSLGAIALLTGAFNDSARKAGWSAAAISGAFLLATNPDKVKRLLGQ
ncbi:MAG TPA: hypothetical protein VNA20_16220 [Frankiaceae bacterium]|nr:hypothetical protein [Frankiaceae bacterium]